MIIVILIVNYAITNILIVIPKILTITNAVTHASKL